MSLERSDITDTARVPAGKPETRYPSPNKADLTVVETPTISPENYRPLPYGTPHPTFTNTGLVLVWQGSVKAANNQVKIVRVYSNNRGPENWYNYAFHYGGDLATVPIFIRSYIVLRTDFAPATRGQPFKGIYKLVVTAQGSGYTPGDPPPTVAITGGGGSGATANAIMDETQTKVIGFELTAEGDNYTGNAAIACTGGTGTGVAGTAYIQPTTALLVKEETVKLDTEDKQLASLFIKVHRIYETLPGAILIWDSYHDERGAVERTSQPILRVGNEVAAFTRPSTGLARKTWFEPRDDSAVVLNKIIENWTEVVVNDQEVTSEFGGGILGVTERRATPGAQTPDVGLLVTASKTETVSPAEQVKKTKTLIDDDEWPELIGSETDPRYGIVIDFAKKVIDAGIIYPGIPLSIDFGGASAFRDIQTHDKWRSIQIVSKVRLPLPDPLTWYTTHHIDLPSELQNVTASWDRTGGESAEGRLSRGYSNSGGPGKFGAVQIFAAGGVLSGFSSSDSGLVAEVSTSVNNGVMGSIEVLFKHGYRGPAIARVTRYFFFGPPAITDITAITKIIPVTGTASLIGKHTSFRQSKGTGPSLSLGTQGQLQTRALTFGPFLSGSVVSNQQTFSANPSIAAASAGPDLDGGAGEVSQYSATAVLPGAQGLLNVNIPVSTPVSIASGTWIVVDAPVEEWRFGVFVLHVIEARVP
jgi:hypothetical protein